MIGRSDELGWIRCQGKGSFLVSNAMKSFAEASIEDGAKTIVIDLEACTGMDSTFMGTMAGISNRIKPIQGRVHVTGVSERNRHSLEDLGLDYFLDIEPRDASWRGREQVIRSGLKPWKEAVTQVEHARQVLEAHQTLAGRSEENERKFSGVIEMLQADLAKPSSGKRP